MPRVDGLEVCRRLRDAGDRTPVLMLTARDAVERPRRRARRRRRRLPRQAVRAGGAQGARPRAAPARRRARRSQRPVALGPAHGPATYDVFRGERRIALTRTEFQLLRYFLENPRQVLSRTQLFEGVWGYDFGATSNSLGVHIGYLRRKLGSRRRATSAAHGPRRRLHPARATVSLRRRITLVGAAAVAVAVVLACTRRLRRRSRRAARAGRRAATPAGRARSSACHARSAISEAQAAGRGRFGQLAPKRAVRSPTSKRCARTERHATTSRRPARTAFPSTPSTERSPPGGGSRAARRDRG